MVQARGALEGHVDAVLAQPLDVALALVAQHVVLGGHDERRRQAAQRRHPHRADARVGRVGRVGDVVPHEPAHAVARQAVALGELGVGGGAGVDVVGDRIDEDLAAEVRRSPDRAAPAPSPSPACRRRCRPCTNSRSRSAPSSSACAMNQRAAGERVVGRGRERMLGREPVVHGAHDRAGARRDLAAQRIVGLEIADDEAAAVEIDDAGEGPRARAACRAAPAPRRPRQAPRDRSTRATSASWPGDRRHLRPQVGAGPLGREGVQRRCARQALRGEQSLDLGVERHTITPYYRLARRTA